MPTPSMISARLSRAAMSLALGIAWVGLVACDRVGPPQAATNTSGDDPAIRQSRQTSMGDAVLEMEFSLDRAEMTVADRVNATLTITARSEAAITAPPVAESLGDFNVVSGFTHESVAGSKRTLTQHLVLEPFLAGDKSIPALEVLATDGARKLALRTEPIGIHVAAAADADATESTPLAPARAPVALGAAAAERASRLVWMSGGVVIAFAVAIMGFVGMRRRRARLYNRPVSRLQRDLAAASGLLAVSESRESALAAATSLRGAIARFLHDHLALPAPTSTPEELRRAISASSLLEPDRRAISTLLDELDRARFSPGGISGPSVRLLLERTAAWAQAVSQVPCVVEGAR